MGALTLAGRLDASFPSRAHGRLALIYKILDCIYVLGVRLGFEIVRNQMTELIQFLFSLFDRAVGVVQDQQQQQPHHEGIKPPVRFFSNCESDVETRGILPIFVFDRI